MNEQQQENSVESARSEYFDVSENIRHYSNLRFTIFTVYLAVVGGVSVIAFGTGQFAQFVVTPARVLGLLATIVFFFYEQRTNDFHAHFLKVATRLERQLAYGQYSSRPSARFGVLHARSATSAIFFLLAVFWMYTIFFIH